MAVLITTHPKLVFAASPRNFREVVGLFLDILGRIVPVIFSLALLYFFWGVAKYIYSSGDEKAAEEGKAVMLWGVIGLFVMVSIFGILQFLKRSFL